MTSIRERAQRVTETILRELRANQGDADLRSGLDNYRAGPVRGSAGPGTQRPEADSRGAGVGARPSFPPPQCLARGDLLPCGKWRLRAHLRQRKRHAAVRLQPRANISKTRIFGATAFTPTTSAASMPGSRRCSRVIRARSSIASGGRMIAISGSATGSRWCGTPMGRRSKSLAPGPTLRHGRRPKLPANLRASVLICCWARPRSSSTALPHWRFRPKLCQRQHPADAGLSAR